MEIQEQEMRREDHSMFEQRTQQQSFEKQSFKQQSSEQQRVSFVAEDQETCKYALESVFLLLHGIAK